jgi:hypothetical protein
VALQREGLFSNPVEEDEVEEEIHEEGYQTLEEEKESPHDSIENNEDLSKERDPEEVTHEEDHQVHKVEHELPCEPVEEHFDEARHVEDPNHKEAHHEDKTSIFAPLSNEDEVIQASIAPTHEEENVVSYTSFQVSDVASFHDLESEEVLEEPCKF